VYVASDIVRISSAFCISSSSAYKIKSIAHSRFLEDLWVQK
jgi:hypothetical protein